MLAKFSSWSSRLLFLIKNLPCFFGCSAVTIDFYFALCFCFGLHFCFGVTMRRSPTIQVIHQTCQDGLSTTHLTLTVSLTLSMNRLTVEFKCNYLTLFWAHIKNNIICLLFWHEVNTKYNWFQNKFEKTVSNCTSSCSPENRSLDKLVISLSFHMKFRTFGMVRKKLR